ncbi:MAG: hypothetical protein LAT56_11855 [Wenzhouxiangella sp.]|nr:hypothetical protein [Wenzhouxiangella sp.]
MRTKICGSLLKKAKVNVCLEGSEFCSANAARGWKNRYPLGFDSVERLREDVPLELVVLGNSECSIADKVAAIDRRAFFGREGVIERVSGDERLKRVEAVIKDSMMLKQLCASCDATYHEVSVRGFKESVQSIAGRIAAHRQ